MRVVERAFSSPLAAGPLAAGLAVTLLLGCAMEVEPLRPDAPPRFDASMVTPEDCVDEEVAIGFVLQPRCGSSDCHDDERPSAGLDLVTPGVTDRVIGAPSVHEECPGAELVVPGVAQASFLMDKVLGQEGACGDPMPRDGDLTLDERRCLVRWIQGMQ